MIENNRSRFKDGIDIIDLLNQSDGFRNFAKENGLIGSINKYVSDLPNLNLN
ncbi:hypothetical protein FC63_GL001542 [Lactobacillus amylovorus DSM 20531]|nr:hypothetical protein FC63_GL001542 [Lactobacillus amylovorus DSM 20531]